VGADFPLLADIQKHVVDAGKSQVSGKDKVGQVLYNRGIYNSMLIAEAIRRAQEITGNKVVTGEDVRRGLEGLNIDDARLKEIGLEGFTGAVKLSCTDHNGHFSTYRPELERHDLWKKVSDYIAPMSDKVGPLLDADAKAYAEKNAPWPARSEACDAS
jgi:branched-chain amino acid transport system substrate-binding protein